MGKGGEYNKRWQVGWRLEVQLREGEGLRKWPVELWFICKVRSYIGGGGFLVVRMKMACLGKNLR